MLILALLILNRIRNFRIFHDCKKLKKGVVLISQELWSKTDHGNRFSGLKNPYFDTSHDMCVQKLKFDIFSLVRQVKMGMAFISQEPYTLE